MNYKHDLYHPQINGRTRHIETHTPINFQHATIHAQKRRKKHKKEALRGRDSLYNS